MRKDKLTAMRSLINISPGLILILLGSACQQKTWELNSPDGNLLIAVNHQDVDGVDALSYSVSMNGDQVILNSSLGLSYLKTGENNFSDLTFLEMESSEIDESYPMPVGKKSNIENRGNEMVIKFKNQLDTELQLHLRASNEGVAYRYHIAAGDSLVINREYSSFNLPMESEAWIQDYHETYEMYYLKRKLSATETLYPLTSSQKFYRDGFKNNPDYAFPVLANTPSGKWLYITEAATDGDYAGGQLFGDENDASILKLKLGSKVLSGPALLTPWRVIMVSDQLKAIVESNLIMNLNPPCKLQDTDWIMPGTSTFPWLTDHGVNGSPERLKAFVDMAADMGWKWIEFDNALAFGIDTGWKTPFASWMTIDWIPDFVAYASSKGIKVTGWDVWNNLDTPEKRDSILGYFNRVGFSGIKVDFLNSDTQERFQFRDDIIKACADRKLMISFHGATLPRGQQRTWPHIATIEGVLGEEMYTFQRGQATPGHNVSLCFTRNIAGSMDYTPSSFSLPGTSGFERTTTDAHEMALAVVFESGWQNIGASPEALAGTRARDFLKNLPAAWDDIHFIDGHPDTHCVLARRKGNTWYLAGINTEEARKLSVSLDFLKEGNYEVILYSDDRVGKVIASEMQVHTSKVFDVEMIKNGGFGVVFKDAFKE